MLACGSVCQPTEIVREIETIVSSTNPARVQTDAGVGFIKGTNNPAGAGALIAEVLAGELGTWFGLSIPAFAIIPRCDIKILMANGHPIEEPVFFSQAVENAIPRDGSDVLLRRLRRKEDITKLVFFDTWIRNTDRYSDDGSNSDNLLFTPAGNGRWYDLAPIDHTHCFVEGTFDDDMTEPGLIEDQAVYGLFPEFVPFITEEAGNGCVNQLNNLDPNFVRECVNSIPREWRLLDASKDTLVTYICERAAFVAATLPFKILDQANLPDLG